MSELSPATRESIRRHAAHNTELSFQLENRVVPAGFVRSVGVAEFLATCAVPPLPLPPVTDR
jgi:hypothetical protein